MPLATISLNWNPWAPSWVMAAVFAALGVLLVWLYRIDARRLTRTQRWILFAWRALITSAILLLLMEPSYRLTTTQKRPPVAAVVVDESTSMSLPTAVDDPFIDVYGDKDRAKRSRYAAARKAASLLIPSLARTHRVRLFIASDRVRSIGEFPSEQAVKPEDVAAVFEKNPLPTGDYSNLGEAIQDVVRESENARLSAIFFLTDGRLTGGTDLARAASDAEARKIPVHTIGFGTTEPLPDLRLADLVAPPEANVNDVMPIQVTVINALRPSLRAELKMFEGDAKEPVATLPLVLPMGEQRVGIATVPRREGEVKYTLTLPTFPEELEHENNTLSFHVNVVKRRLKVLLVAGAPTMEFHHLVPTLIRDRVIRVSCWLQTADVNAVQQGNEVIDDLPRTAAQWNAYDVVILNDIDPNKFTNEQENGLEELIQNGGGLLFVAGRVNGMASLLQVRGAKMQAMLPVEINKNLYPDSEEVFTEPFHCVRTREGMRHPLLIFAPRKEENDAVWKSFGDLDFFWTHPLTDVKRQAVPLLARQREGGSGTGRDCVMALMRYGKGSTVFLGINTMWRWRFPMESFDYDQFWSQTCRYLAEYRMLGSQRQVLLTTDKKEYAPGETVNVQLSILDPALVSQLRTEETLASVTDQTKGEYRIPLRPSDKDESARLGRFMARRIGEHEVRAQHVLAADLAARKSLFDEKTHFAVRMLSLEFKDTTADLAALSAVAERTGGVALDHTNAGQGLKTLASKVDRTPQLIQRESFDELWDRWYVLALLLALGAGELWFRRSWGLL